MKPQEAHEVCVESADPVVGGRRRFLNQISMDIGGSNASMNPTCTLHEERSQIEHSCCVHVTEEGFDDGNTDMVFDDKKSSSLYMNGLLTSSPFSQGFIIPGDAGLCTTPNLLRRQIAGESGLLEHNGDVFGDKFQHFGRSDKTCKKRISGSHLSGDTERRSKKSRNSVSEESAGVTGTPYLPKEPVRSKRGWAQYKSPSTQEKSGKKNWNRGGCRMEVLLSAPSSHGLSEDGTGATGGVNARKNILSWLIEAGALVKDQKLFYLHKGKKNLGHGWVTNAGVLCGCCNDIFTLSYFEEHCGSRLHRPCQNIFVDGGKSLTELQMEVFQKENDFTGSSVHSKSGSGKRRRPEKEEGKVEGDGSDDTCGVCGDGGTLICCDHCPSTFHLTCMDLLEVPKDEWYCPNCRCAICDGSQFNGDQNTFNELTVLFCDQCEREFHVKCLYERGFPKMDHCPEGSWFCSESCTQIYQSLRGLVGVTNLLSRGFTWTLLRSQAEDSDPKSDGDKELLIEHNIKLSMALSVMQECFKPMIDPRTNIDLVSHVLYNRGSDVSRLNYRGFYTMILENEDELVSVATIRVHGNELAEMPLIGTRYRYRRQGMCRRLMYAIEQMLHSIGVKSLVLPAVPELMETWTGAFGFQALSSCEKKELTKLNIMAFPGTSLLQKSLPGWPSNSSFKGLLHNVAGTVQVHNISVPQMVNVPIGGPDPFLSGQDVDISHRGGFLHNYLAKMRGGATGHSMFGSDSPASFPSPRAIIPKKEPIHNQHSGAQFDRCRENGITPKQKLENSYSSKVVVGTTRSKRLVKTTQWVVDAMNELAGRPAQTDEPGTNVCADKQLTVGTSDSPSAASCMADSNEDEPRKLILRINLSKMKEEKREREGGDDNAIPSSHYLSLAPSLARCFSVASVNSCAG